VRVGIHRLRAVCLAAGVLWPSIMNGLTLNPTSRIREGVENLIRRKLLICSSGVGALALQNLQNACSADPVYSQGWFFVHNQVPLCLCAARFA
jgi:hypothetical protein